MPFLDNIVQQLNEKIITSSLNFITRGKIKAYGIAETMFDVMEDIDGNKITIVYPGMVDTDGEGTMIEIDDTYSIIMYHRLEGIINAIAPKTNYGDKSDMLESSNMSLVVIGFRDTVRKTSYWLEGAIKDQFPELMKVAGLQRSNLRIGNSTFDKIALLAREYSGVKLNFLHLLIFELKYRIESTYRKGCFDTCGADCESTTQ